MISLIIESLNTRGLKLDPYSIDLLQCFPINLIHSKSNIYVILENIMKNYIVNNLLKAEGDF